jgi:hypothetical protein
MDQIAFVSVQSRQLGPHPFVQVAGRLDKDVTVVGELLPYDEM